jgi:hypothetical protein
MKPLLKIYLIIVMIFIAFSGIARESAFGFQMTIDAMEDAGRFPGQEAYLKFVYSSGEHLITPGEVSNPWTGSSQVYSYANSKGIPGPWGLESAGNIWATDKIVGDALTNLNAGIYRISVVGGAFMYDSFGWSDYANQWRWELLIQTRTGQDVLLGDTRPFETAELALSNNIGKYVDIPVTEGGSLTFWLYDTNSIDNSGSLTIDVTDPPPSILVPEPSTLFLAGTGLLFLVCCFRRSRIHSLNFKF